MKSSVDLALATSWNKGRSSRRPAPTISATPRSAGAKVQNGLVRASASSPNSEITNSSGATSRS